MTRKVKSAGPWKLSISSRPGHLSVPRAPSESLQLTLLRLPALPRPLWLPLPLAAPPVQVPGSPGPQLPEQAGGLTQGPQIFLTTQGCPGLSLGPWTAAARSVSVDSARPHALPESCGKEELHDQPAGSISQKEQTPRGGAGVRGTSCSMRPGLRAPSPTGRSEGPRDSETTLSMPKTTTLSQHWPLGATHQGHTPDRAEHWSQRPRTSWGVQAALLPAHTRPQELPQKGPLLLSPV